MANPQCFQEFASRLYAKIKESQEPNYQNVFFSPMSLYAALSMTLAGSDGTTKQQLMNALCCTASVDHGEAFHVNIGQFMAKHLHSTAGVEVKLANSLFVDGGLDLNTHFQNVLTKSYNSNAEKVVFGNTEAARQHINSWARRMTGNKIEELFSQDSLSSETKLVIANAIFFQGGWELVFDQANTKPGSFHDLQGQIHTLPMMDKTDLFYLADTLDIEAKAVKMKFKESCWSMIVVLPNSREDFEPVAQKLTSLTWLQHVLDGEYVDQSVRVVLPRFKLTHSAMQTKEVLQSLGIQDLFTTRANLTGMSSSPLFVHDVAHKAILEVNEVGASAAASTGLAMRPRALIIPEQFQVDRPFFVILVVENKIPVFLGHVVLPEALQ